ncbi:MAG: BT4734/BF3469 family protein, partial [Opitutaceae bacterium]
MNIHDPANPVFVSLVPPLPVTACTRVNVREELEKIRNGEWAARVAQVREALASHGKTAANALKKTLPGHLWSGEFTRRNNSAIVRRSGLVCVDFDNVESPLHLLALLAADPHCVAAWLSPSGTGIKALFVVDPARKHGEGWRAVNKHCKAVTGLEIDAACKEVARLCFVSHHPEMFIAPGEVQPVPYPVAEAVPVAATEPTADFLTPGDDYNARGDVPALLRKHGWTSNDDANWTRPGKESGCSATLGQLDEHPRALFVFSSNAAPFAANQTCSPFQVFTLLECGGDYALATAKLLELGFGARAAEGETGTGFIILPSANGLSISEAAGKIFGRIAATRTLFSRGRIPHEVLADENGSRLEPVTARAFRSRLEKHGRLMAWRSDRDGKRKLSPAICAEETAGALLVTTEARDLLPRIRAIITSPILAPHGSDELVTLEHGWNPQNGGVFVTGHITPAAVPLDEAVSALCALLDDFDFQSAGDRSRALASVVTPALKAGGLLTASTPVEVCEAD